MLAISDYKRQICRGPQTLPKARRCAATITGRTCCIVRPRPMPRPCYPTGCCHEPLAGFVGAEWMFCAVERLRHVLCSIGLQLSIGRWALDADESDQRPRRLGVR